MIHLSSTTLVYKRLGVVKGTKTLKLGSRMEKCKCYKLWCHWARQMTKQGEPGGLGRPWPPKGTAAPASTGRCLEGVHGRVSGPDFPKESRNVDFPIYKYQKLNIFEIPGLNPMRLEVRWFYPRERWGRPGRDMRGTATNGFLGLGWVQGCVPCLSMSWSHTLMVCSKISTDLDSTVW